MKITDLLKKEGILLNAEVADQNAAIDALVELHEKSGNLNNVSGYKKAILAREEKGSTAIGMGIAVPHAKSDSVAKPGLSAMTVPAGIDYKSLDGNPSKLFFMIAAPDGATSVMPCSFSGWPSMTRVAIFAMGTPVLLEMNGTVREERG